MITSEVRKDLHRDITKAAGDAHEQSVETDFLNHSPVIEEYNR